MCFDEDLVYAIIQGNIATLKSFDLDSTIIDQRISFTPKNRCPTNSFVLPPVPFPTPLVYAICCRQYNVVDFLIKQDAVLTCPINNVFSIFIWYPIHYAVATRDVKTVETILNNSDVEVELERKTLNDGAAPIHIAVASGNIELILFLLRHGCDVNSKNKEGQTPLHLSMIFPDDIIPRALLAYHANITAKDDKGRKPSEIAKLRNNQFVADTMIFYENQCEQLPEINEIELEIAQQDVSRMKKRQNIIIKNSHGSEISSSKIEEVDHRLQEVETKIEQVFTALAKVKPGSKISALCAGCFSPRVTLCKQCNIAFCDTCIKKERIHKCVANL